MRPARCVIIRPARRQEPRKARNLLSQDVQNCPKCDRRTPSARGTCLYCGATLVVTRIETAPSQRNIDSFEQAFNTVVEPASFQTDSQIDAVAAALSIEASEAGAILGAGKRIPIARSHTRQEAELIAALMRDCGVGASVVGDEELRLQSELARARGIAAESEELHIRLSGGSVALPCSDIKLMVIGSLKNRRVDYSENVRAKSGGVVDTSEYVSGEMLLDLYSGALDRSFRIRSDAFDYSGLVEPLSFRAEENFGLLVARLRALAPNAGFDDDFARVRPLLGRAWPERSRSEARGVKRKGLSLRPVAQSSVISDNRDQFDRYSRLIFVSEIR